MHGRFAALRASGAEIAKLAVQVESLEQLSALFDVADGAGPDRARILIAMGPAGLPSRVLSARLGSRWTYAGDNVAPGQVTAARLLQRLPVSIALPPTPRSTASSATRSCIRARRSCTTPGSPRLGVNAVYVPLQARDAEDFVRFARRRRLAGREHHRAVQGRA